MKVGKLLVNLMKIGIEKQVLKRKKLQDLSGFDIEYNIPYLNDGDDYHVFDYVHAKGNKRNICIIDIHGGSYMFCRCHDNLYYASKYAEQGYDVVCLDYRPNDGKSRSTKDLIDDAVKGLIFVFNHKKDLGLENHRFVLTGDSAGGHISLLIAEAISDKQFANELGYDFNNVKIDCVLVNSPAYDFVNLGRESLTKSGLKRMFGPRYNDEQLNKLISPKEHIESLNMPIFVSTSKLDFIRTETMKLKQDLGRLNLLHEFIDIDSDDQLAIHVHNVIYPDTEESIKVNVAMMGFINNR